MDLHKDLGSPPQARTIPTIIEQIANGQITVLRNVFNYVFATKTPEHYSNSVAYYRHPEKTDGGLPTYSFIVDTAIRTQKEMTKEEADRTMSAILSRFGARAVVDPPTCNEAADGWLCTFSWRIHLDKEVIEAFESQVLPTFETSPNQMVEVHVTLRQPLKGLALYTVREKLEACGAVYLLEAFNDYRLRAVMPGTVLLESCYADDDRLFYLQNVLEEWGVERVIAAAVWSGDDLLQQRVHESVEPDYLAAKADSYFLSKKISEVHAGRLLRLTPTGIRRRRLVALFGESNLVTLSQQAWNLPVRVRDSLLVFEGIDDEVTSVFLAPGTLPFARVSDKMMEMIKG